MNILFASSEAVPFIASGGLGDVAGSLPNALTKEGAKVSVVLPLYKNVKEKYIDKLEFLTHFEVCLGWRNQYCGIFKLAYNDVDYYFIDNEFYFCREGGIYGHLDDGERFAFFSKAILDMIKYTDIKVDLIHTNDWQTALVNLFINIFYREDLKFCDIKTVFTIHNIQYQGQYGSEVIGDMLGIPLEWQHHLEYKGCANFMKAAIENADKVTTVSPTYAKEILTSYYAHELDELLNERKFKLSGILNGIDYVSHNPKTDEKIAKTYHADAFKMGKKACKKALREEFNLHNDNSPIISMVTRLVEHKGIPIIIQAMQGLIDMGYQVVVLGSGDSEYENFFNYLASKYPGRVGVYIGFVPALARKIYAGSDMFLMPSKSEPCGLSQMISLRYGTVPIVRETGGLADSIKDSLDGIGNGFTFKNYTGDDLYKACERAYNGYQDKDGFAMLIKRGMTTDCSWQKSAKEYIEMYNSVLNLW